MAYWFKTTWYICSIPKGTEFCYKCADLFPMCKMGPSRICTWGLEFLGKDILSSSDQSLKYFTNINPSYIGMYFWLFYSLCGNVVGLNKIYNVCQKSFFLQEERLNCVKHVEGTFINSIGRGLEISLCLSSIPSLSSKCS